MCWTYCAGTPGWSTGWVTTPCNPVAVTFSSLESVLPVAVPVSPLEFVVVEVPFCPLEFVEVEVPFCPLELVGQVLVPVCPLELVQVLAASPLEFVVVG